MRDTRVANYINHILFVIDASGSMGHLRDSVVKVFGGQIDYLAKRSQEMDQETRVTVFMFNYSNAIECLIYDKDVLRLPSLRSLYTTGGNTALIDATMQAISGLQETPETYGDHAFLGYVITDGQENASCNTAPDLKRVLATLPDNWTLAVLVPDQRGVHDAKTCGFSADNIGIWDSTSVRGMEEVGRRIRTATDHFMHARTQGVRKITNLFTLDMSGIRKSVVKAKLEPLGPKEYLIKSVKQDSAIRDFVKKTARISYSAGIAFYQLMKPETIQYYKDVCVRDRKTGAVYGGSSARQVLGLPNVKARVTPVMMGDYDVFVQSTSVNRRLIAGTELLIRR